MKNNKPETGVRLYIGGFPRRTTKSELEEFCSRYGKLKYEIDLIPNKPFAFVTFTSKEEATLAMFAIQQEMFKGARLHVDWANKRRQEEKDKDKEWDSAKPVTTPQSPAKNSKLQDSKTPGVKEMTKRYIPGDMKEETVTSTPAVTKESDLPNAENPTEPEIIPEPLSPILTPIPNLIGRTHYPESNPPLEITIRDTLNNDIKYSFRIKSLTSLKNYLLHEANHEVSASNLFHTSSQKNEKTIFYGGIPVVHIYQDLLGKEMLEPRENKEDREYFLGKKDYRYLEIPEARVPISHRKIPVEEVYHLLSKNYELILLNTSANGPSAPLHPGWKPLPHTYTFRKGNQLIVFYGNTIVESFQFLLQSTSNQSYRDLLPILLKYNVCIFNSNKGAFITPEQLQ